MRKALVILLLAWVLLFPRAFKAAAPVPQESQPSGGIDSYSEGEDDIFSSSYERELLSRRFFQKTLAPLSRREKIAWAFKTSQASILL